MTAARSTLRRRRARLPDGGMPDEVRAWFAGETAIPWAALLPPTHALVRGWWSEWQRDHPAAAGPPADAIVGTLEARDE